MVGGDGRIQNVGPVDRPAGLTATLPSGIARDTHDADVLPAALDDHADTRVTRVDAGRVAILPGLTNAHSHLELAGLRGRIPRGDSMPLWAERVIAARRMDESPDPTPIGTAVDEAWSCGTALVGDVSNTWASLGPLSRSRLGGVIFKELIGFDVAGAPRARSSARPSPRRGGRRGRGCASASRPMHRTRSPRMSSPSSAHSTRASQGCRTGSIWPNRRPRSSCSNGALVPGADSSNGSVAGRTRGRRQAAGRCATLSSWDSSAPGCWRRTVSR